MNALAAHLPHDLLQPSRTIHLTRHACARLSQLEKGEQMMGLDSTGPPQDRAIALWRALGLDNDHAKDAKRKAELEAPADGEDEVMSQGHRLISEAFEHGGYAA